LPPSVAALQRTFTPLGVDAKTIQAILRHSSIGITQNIYIKSVTKSQVSAMDSLSDNLGTCNDLATPANRPVSWSA
jgi:integrase